MDKLRGVQRIARCSRCRVADPSTAPFRGSHLETFLSVYFRKIGVKQLPLPFYKRDLQVGDIVYVDGVVHGGDFELKLKGAGKVIAVSGSARDEHSTVCVVPQYRWEEGDASNRKLYEADGQVDRNDWWIERRFIS